MQKKYKILIYITLILAVLGSTFIYSIQKDMHRSIPEPVNRHLNALGIAISELKYGLKGYCGYNKITDTLIKNGMTNDQRLLDKYGMSSIEALKNAPLLNSAIKKAMEVADPSSGGRYYLFRDDKGLVTYYKLAFKIFGYRIESFLYFYFLLLILSIAVFLSTFHRRLDLLNILLLFTCGHFIIVVAAEVVGIQLQTVHNARFLPILAILPTLYLALLILGKTGFNKLALLGALIQASILVFVIHIRGAAIYQVVFLCAVFSAAFFWAWIRRPGFGKYILNKIQFWPLLIVFFALFILKLHLALSLNYPYATISSKRIFWYTVYIGLAAHPDSMAKYGITYDDTVANNFVRRRLTELYGRNISISPESNEGVALYEAILKKEFLRIAKADLGFMLINYLNKPYLFIKNYFSATFGARQYLFNPILLLIVITGAILGGNILFENSLVYLLLFVLWFGFSLLPSIFAMPELYLIAEPALLFTMLIYLLISIAASQIKNISRSNRVL